MTAGSIPPASVTGGAVFDVEHFAWSTPERLQLTGVWYGVRGLRFVRPTLMLRAEGVSRRLLATLDHKPWAAEDGAPWLAEFPWSGEPLEFDEAELAVTTSVVLALEPPQVPGSARRKKATRDDGKSRALLQEREAARQERDAALAARETALRERDEALETRNAAIAESGATAQAQRERLREEAAAARSEAEQLRAGFDEERERARRERDALRARVGGVETARDEALLQVEKLTAQLAAAQAAAPATDTLVQERDHARHVARELHGRLKSTETALQEAARERDELLAEVGGARPDVEAIARERDDLRVALDAVTAERDALHAATPAADTAAVDALARERDELRSWLDRLGSERDELRARLEREARDREELRARIDAPDSAARLEARDYRERFEAAQAALDATRAELAEHQERLAAAPVVAPSAPRPVVSGPPSWAARLLALGALTVLIVILAVITHTVG